jgi:hypothetical protein
VTAVAPRSKGSRRAPTPIHRIAEKVSSRKQSFRCKGFSETRL